MTQCEAWCLRTWIQFRRTLVRRASLVSMSQCFSGVASEQHSVVLQYRWRGRVQTPKLAERFYMAVLQAQHTAKAQACFGGARIDRDDTAVERFGAAKLRACGTDSEDDSSRRSSRPDKRLHARRRQRLVEAPGQQQQNRIVGEQPQCLAEVIGVQLETAEQCGRRGAIPVAHG